MLNLMKIMHSLKKMYQAMNNKKLLVITKPNQEAFKVLIYSMVVLVV
jgi:hypothetical protein